MKKPVTIINLEKEIGIRLTPSKYEVDEHGEIIGLTISNRKFRNLSALSDLLKLRRLDLGGNRIRNLSALTNLKELVSLNLRYNIISDLSYISNLKQLRELSLRHNKIKNLIPLSNLENLSVLDLGYNEIKDISPLINFTKIVSLDLNDNHITHIPIEFLENGLELHYYVKEYFDAERAMYLSDNPLASPPKEVIINGQEAIKAYYESLKKEQIIIKEVKLLFLGEGSAGKTTLMKSLLGDKVNPAELQTHGINQQKWTVDDDIQVNMWDFGGQEIQHSVHQFFLTERSIYVLVLDNRKEEKPEYWLQHILSLAGDSQIVVVSNKIDEDAHKIDQFDASFLKEKYPNIMGFYHVSALHNINIEDLKSNLEKLIRQHTFPVFSADWVKIKNTVEESISLGKNYMTVETYKAYCEDLQIPDNQQITLLDYLNDTGTLSYFGKSLHTKGLYILNPEWLTLWCTPIVGQNS